MKKLIALFTIVLTGIGFASCTGSFDTTSLDQMSSKQSLATLSYLSSGFLSLEEEPQLQTTKLSVEKQATVNEDQLEEVNKYFSILKPFISRGPDAFASVEDQESDREEYDYLLNMSVNDNEFKLYYNINVLSKEITGIFIIEGIEYEIVAHSSLDDFGDFDEVTTEEPVTDEETTETPVTEETTTEEPVTEESTTEEETTTEEATTETSTTLLSEDDDEDEDDDDDDEDEFDNEDDDDEEDDEDEIDDEDEYENEEEIEREMTLVAKNGEDTITIKYEFESEDGESKTEFEILKNINGVETLITVEIEIEEDEYTLAIVDGENVYDFSMENDDDGEIEYELEYEVDGVNVEIEITEYTDENGNVYYEYEYEEEGRQVVIEKDDEFDHDDDDEDDDDDDDDDDDQVSEEATV